MLVIVIAHHREAEALIEHYSLKQNRAFCARPVFELGNIRLVVSGQGALNAAIATTLACADLNPDTPLALLNFGICGGETSLQLGTLFHVDQIFSPASAKYYYPDMILRLSLTGSGLETRERAYQAGESLPLSMPLVDMEGAGFFEAARNFAPPSRIFILKLLSDHGETFAKIKGHFGQLISAQFNQICSAIDTVLSWIDSWPELQQKDITHLLKVKDSLSLTESQYQQLLFLSRARAPHGDLQTILGRYLNDAPIDKNMRKRIFNEVTDALRIPLI